MNLIIDAHWRERPPGLVDHRQLIAAATSCQCHPLQTDYLLDYNIISYLSAYGAPTTELPIFIDYLRHGCKVPTLFSPCEPRVPCESQSSQGYFVIDEQYDVSNHIVRLFLYDIEMPLGLMATGNQLPVSPVTTPPLALRLGLF